MKIKRESELGLVARCIASTQVVVLHGENSRFYGNTEPVEKSLEAETRLPFGLLNSKPNSIAALVSRIAPIVKHAAH
jgi:hypothetical protein